MPKIGFLVNPIAGMGGSVGLKGTDGKEILKKARTLGAKPTAQIRAKEMLDFVFRSGQKIKWLTCSGEMGEDAIKAAGFQTNDYEVVHSIRTPHSSKDTKSACEKFRKKNVNLIVFCGGDGTARDVFAVAGKDVPMIGIPAGVKMFSACFGVTPKATAEIVLGFVRGMLTTTEAEILDIDEEKYRKGALSASLFGYASTPYESTLIQQGKSVFEGMDEEAAKKDIARYVVELMNEERDTVFILGAGSTLEEIKSELRIEKTLLGVDVVKDGKLIAKDANEEKLLEILKDNKKARIIIGVIGVQGFVFGRGSQQMSPKVIKKVGLENIRIVATPHKMSQTPCLRVDTGDEKLNLLLAGFHRVITGYHEMRMARVEVGS